RFFFSSRRRHTRSKRDWSSDVCSSDLLTDYVLPEGVRIGDASRIRLGAHLSPGTVVMHEGFVNFNAGTLGSSMVEGRISQGVVRSEERRVGEECRGRWASER